MAKATHTHVTDDIDGTADAETVTFGFEGAAYSIDLSRKNLDKLSKVFAPFIENATKEKGSSVRTTKRRTNTSQRSYDIVRLREWAAKNKITVAARGRIAGAVVDQYRAAGGR